LLAGAPVEGDQVAAACGTHTRSWLLHGRRPGRAGPVCWAVAMTVIPPTCADEGRLPRQLLDLLIGFRDAGSALCSMSLSAQRPRFGTAPWL
jgi:hypothetical protein